MMTEIGKLTRAAWIEGVWLGGSLGFFAGCAFTAMVVETIRYLSH